MLATDGYKTYVLFIYEDIQWATDLTIIGFNTGDGMSFYTLPESMSPDDILNLDTTSNVAISGTYIFRVDQDELVQIEGTYILLFTSTIES